MTRTISNNGINLIKNFEGCRLSAYRDAVGVITIGYGWTKAIDGKPLIMGTKITQAKAESLLKEGLKSYESKVNKYNNKYRWNQNQFDALVSFCYNIGNIDGITANGTRSINEIANKFTAYNKAGGKVLSGLTNRRNAEKKLFLTDISSDNDNSKTNKDQKYTHKDFVKEVQAAIGAKVDGVAGSETLSKTVTVSKKKNNRHPVIKPIQKYLNSIGFNVGVADGIAGSKFDKSIRLYQKDIVGMKNPDGEITKQKKTWCCLLGMY